MRLRRLLRRIVKEAVPDGSHLSAADIANRALMLERSAVAVGVSWRGFSPAQAALVIVLAARFVTGIRTAQVARLEEAGQRFAEVQGLGAFARDVAADFARKERLTALRRHGHPSPPGWLRVVGSVALS